MKTTTICFHSFIAIVILATFTSCNTGVKPEVEQTTVKTDKASAKNELSFVVAAKAVTPAVVHIKTTYPNQGAQHPYGLQGRGAVPMGGSGSGVLISADGYIATNNHVIENAERIEVILSDRRGFIAELVGRDPNTDLALLKIKGSNFPFAKMGNSDLLEVGEWVLAIGYPFSLNTTVTAGIVSAKGRSIGIINTSADGATQSNSAIESFIQTDAAINPGNSGGALVNTAGELIGINTAIASLTGSYAGYAFAVPVTLANKILKDLQEFKRVKRGVLGVSFPAPSVEDAYFKQEGIDPSTVKGVFITGIQAQGAASAAGLQAGDILQSIDGVDVSSSADFSERVARHRPGDKIALRYLRKGKAYDTEVVLQDEAKLIAANNEQSLKEIYDKLGARFSTLSPALQQRLQLNGGVVVTEVRRGGFFSQIGIPVGTIIAYINGREVRSPEDIEKALLAASNTKIQVFAIAPDGSQVVFDFSLGA